MTSNSNNDNKKTLTRSLVGWSASVFLEAPAKLLIKGHGEKIGSQMDTSHISWIHDDDHILFSEKINLFTTKF